MQLKSSPFPCSSCARHQPCCRNVDWHPIAVMPDEVDAFGEDNVVKLSDEVYVAKPVEKSNACPQYSDGTCGLGKDRPAFCKAYPVLHDGEKWYLDAGCPTASQSVFALAVGQEGFLKHFSRAFRLLADKGQAMQAVVQFRVDRWTAPLVIDLRGIPKSWLKKKDKE